MTTQTMTTKTMMTTLTTTTRLAALVLCGLLALAAPTARASAPEELRRSIETLLSGYEKVPTGDDWARLGSRDAVAAELVQLADGAAASVMAARATASLGHFPTPVVWFFLERRVGDASVAAMLRGKAAIALARAFGDAAAPVVARLFAERDADLREDGLRAWRFMVSPSAERFISARAAREPSPRLAARMRDAGALVARERQARRDDRKLDPSLEAMAEIADPGPVAP